MLPILRNRLVGVAPFQALWDMEREMDRMLDTVWGRTDAEQPSTWAVPADVVENENEIRCTLEVPGLKPDEIEVTVENNVLTVAGEKKFESRQGDENTGTYHQERRYGRFSRSFILPRNVDAGHINANYEHGVLTVVLPKTEESKPRRVQINATAGAQHIT
ncbi:MAG TPA: Hsp20/alpha crystallin family protein, partial [Longimicrobiales bacterium]